MTEQTITFEGDEIEAFAATIRQHKGAIDRPLLLDEFVQLKVIVRVAKVDHGVNQRNGVLERDHILKVMDIEVIDQ